MLTCIWRLDKKTTIRPIKFNSQSESYHWWATASLSIRKVSYNRTFWIIEHFYRVDRNLILGDTHYYNQSTKNHLKVVIFFVILSLMDELYLITFRYSERIVLQKVIFYFSDFMLTQWHSFELMKMAMRLHGGEGFLLKISLQDSGTQSFIDKTSVGLACRHTSCLKYDEIWLLWLFSK